MRDVSLDNFKFILIVFVIIGHLIEPLTGKFEWVKSIYVFIYLFHMPMFAYVSGAVSSKKIDDIVINNIVRKLIIPYILLEIIYSLFDFIIFSRSSITISPLIPYWILWYLFSLILWKILLPIFSQFKFPIILSILAGLACGLNNYDYNLSFSRTFVFFPFFLIGHYKHVQIINKIQNYKTSKFIGASIIIILFITLLIIMDNNSFNFGWLYGSKSYSNLGVEWDTGIFNRFCIYILAILLGIAFLSIVPKKRGFYTEYGEETLYIYILHGFIVKGLLATEFYRYIDNDWKVIILIFSSLTLLPILSSRFSKIIANNMMNPFSSLSKTGFLNMILSNKNIQTK